MIINPLTLISLGSSLLGGPSAMDVAAGVVNGVGSLLGGLGEKLSGEFSEMLNGSQSPLTLISTEALPTDPNALMQNLAGQNLPGAMQTGANPVQQQTLDYLEQILSGKAVIEGQKTAGTNNTDEASANTQTLTENQTAVIGKIQKFLEDNKEQISQANSDEVKGLTDLIGKIVAAAQAPVTPQVTNPVAAAAQADPQSLTDSAAQAKMADTLMPQLLEPKQDPRLLGKDNMSKAIAGAENKNMHTVGSLLDDNKAFDNAIKMNSDGSFEVTGKISNFDQMNKSYIDAKLAAMNGGVARYTNVEPGSYSIAKVSKQANKIEITLEPEALGKVDIRMDFENGKTTMVVSAERKETLELLQKDAKYFERILADSGIKADSGSLSFNLRQQDSGANQFANQQQNRQQNQYNLAIPTQTSQEISDLKNFGIINAYQNVQGVSGLNILV